MLKIKIILGSTREGRFSEKVGPWIKSLVEESGVTPILLDLRDFPMPFLNDSVSPAHIEGAYKEDTVNTWAQEIAGADGFIVVTPEYNHGYSAVLKNALDNIFKEWNNKPIAFVAYGSMGGARVVEQLRAVAIELLMVPIRNAVHIVAPWNLLNDDDTLKQNALDPYTNSAKEMIDQLVEMTKTMRK